MVIDEIWAKIILTAVGILVAGVFGKITGLWKYLSALVRKDFRKEIDELEEHNGEQDSTLKLIQNDIKDLKEDNVLVQNSLLAGIRRDILYDIEMCTKRGYVPWANYDCIIKEYEQYKKLGGNSTVDAMMEEFRRLPHEKIQGEFDKKRKFRR